MTRVLMTDIAGITAQSYEKLYHNASVHRREKADRYLRQEDRLRCIAAWGLLRVAVNRVLGIKEFEIETNIHGKPRIKGAPEFHYNLSHSGQWVVLAYGDNPLGIDVEQIIWDSGKERLIRRFFAPDEQDFVLGQSQQGSAERFSQIWTLKEGYLKYLGLGLQKPLDSFSVLKLSEPNHYFRQIDGNCCMSLWSEDEACTLEVLSVEEIMEVII
jgi:4'-phosphopantetheinyl transferase